jgi:predicted peroxiredoxin
MKREPGRISLTLGQADCCIVYRKELKVGKLLFVGTFATDDPTRASMPFIVASGALDKGHKPTIALMGEAVYLMKKGIVDTVHGVGFPPLGQVVDKILENKVPIYI